MFVGCQAFEDLYSVLRQIEFLQFCEFFKSTQPTDPVILRKMIHKQTLTSYLEVEQLNVWSRFQGFHGAYLVVVEVQHLERNQYIQFYGLSTVMLQHMVRSAILVIP